MVYRQRNSPSPITNGECPVCKSKRLLYSKGKITCHNCGHSIGATYNKYGAKKQEFEGKIYDSRFEASVAADLALRKRVGDILDYDTQYRIEAHAYDENGKLGFVEKHKVDFRIHHIDGSFELYEAKGVETDNYKFKRKCLENLWLPMHPDHIYTVIKQSTKRRYAK